MSGVNNDKSILTDNIYASVFTLSDDSGDQKKALTFSAILLEFGLSALQGSRGAFQTQFDLAQEKVDCMEALNNLMQRINKIKTQFASDAKGDATAIHWDSNTPGTNLQIEVDKFNKNYPNYKLNATFVTNTDQPLITKANLEALASNAQAMQSTLSSENEQQSMRTNQAMNRSSGYLQQLQSMMQSAKEALQAAGKAGGY